MYEVLCQTVSARDYVFRAVVSRIDPWPYLEDGDWVEELSQHCNGVQVHELNACVLTLVSVEASVGDYDKPL